MDRIKITVGMIERAGAEINRRTGMVLGTDETIAILERALNPPPEPEEIPVSEGMGIAGVLSAHKSPGWTERVTDIYRAMERVRREEAGGQEAAPCGANKEQGWVRTHHIHARSDDFMGGRTHRRKDDPK